MGILSWLPRVRTFLVRQCAFEPLQTPPAAGLFFRSNNNSSKKKKKKNISKFKTKMITLKKI